MFLVFTLAGFSQSNLPNGDMEGWHNETANNVEYLQIDGPYWSTLNELLTVPPFIGGPGPQTAFQEGNAHGGQYCARLTSANFNLPSGAIFIPGMMGWTSLQMANNGIKLGKPCPGCKPLRFTGWYKFQQVGNDSCAALIAVTRWDDVLKKRDTIAFAREDFHVSKDSWEQFDLEVEYENTTLVPDSMLVLLVSSGGFSVTNLMGGIGQVGNTMWVDDISVEYPAGISQILMPEVGVKCYPNPASDVMHVGFTKAVENGSFDIYTLDGKFIRSATVNRVATIDVNVSDLSTGTYYFKLSSGDAILNTGFFAVKR
jgi:hypothetical protein